MRGRRWPRKFRVVVVLYGALDAHEVILCSTLAVAKRTAASKIDRRSLSPARKLPTTMLHSEIDPERWRPIAAYSRLLKHEKGYGTSGGVQIEEALHRN